MIYLFVLEFNILKYGVFLVVCRYNFLDLIYLLNYLLVKNFILYGGYNVFFCKIWFIRYIN